MIGGRTKASDTAELAADAETGDGASASSAVAAEAARRNRARRAVGEEPAAPVDIRRVVGQRGERAAEVGATSEGDRQRGQGETCNATRAQPE